MLLFFFLFFACLRACLGRTYDTPVAVDGMASSFFFFFFFFDRVREGKGVVLLGNSSLLLFEEVLTQVAVREIERWYKFVFFFASLLSESLRCMETVRGLMLGLVLSIVFMILIEWRRFSSLVAFHRRKSRSCKLLLITDILRRFHTADRNKYDTRFHLSRS